MTKPQTATPAKISIVATDYGKYQEDVSSVRGKLFHDENTTVVSIANRRQRVSTKRAMPNVAAMTGTAAEALDV